VPQQAAPQLAGCVDVRRDSRPWRTGSNVLQVAGHASDAVGQRLLDVAADRRQLQRPVSGARKPVPDRAVRNSTATFFASRPATIPAKSPNRQPRRGGRPNYNGRSPLTNSTTRSGPPRPDLT
jgi:hypothetical protein